MSVEMEYRSYQICQKYKCLFKVLTTVLMIIFDVYSVCRRRLYLRHHLVQTLLHFVQFALGYLLMLIAMTFNVWLFLSVILGAALGYFLFNYRQLYVDVTEDHCH